MRTDETPNLPSPAPESKLYGCLPLHGGKPIANFTAEYSG